MTTPDRDSPRRRLALPAPSTAAEQPERRRRLDTGTWGGALALMAVIAALLFVVEAIDAASNHRLDRFGLKPREVDGLWGVLASPFLHASWWHLISNMAPFVLLGWVVLLSGLRTWLVVTAIVMFGGAIATWLIAPAGVIVGSSGVVFGWMGYLIARAFFARRLLWIVIAVFVAFFFSGLFAGLLPSISSNVSWQAHVCGFAAGVGAGWLLHPRPPRRTASSSSVS